LERMPKEAIVERLETSSQNCTDTVTKHTSLPTQITRYLGRALKIEPLQS